MGRLMTDEQNAHWGPNGMAFDPNKLQVSCGPMDDKRRRLVVASLYGSIHRDCFDTDSAFSRQKFRERCFKIFGVDDEGIHEALEEQIVAKADAADARSDSEPLSKPKLITLGDVHPIETQWLWEHRFPVGAIVDVTGDPGLGKSQLMTEIAARMTRGDAMPPLSAPDGTYKVQDVLILSAEDDPARTIRPRLDAAGADVNRVHLLRAMTVIDDEDERAVGLPLDVAAIEQVVVEKRVGLIIIDPFEAHIDDGLNTNSNADMRRCLTPLARMAERTLCTVALVRHLNKKEGLSAIYRGGGSVAIVAVCRAAFAVGIDPEDPASRILACIKSNLGPMPKSLTFSVEQRGTTSRVIWGGDSDATASEILGRGVRRRGGATKLDQAKAIIVDILGRGSRGENEVRTACDQAGIKERTYRAARKALKVVSEKTDFDGEWLLSLPNADQGKSDEF